MSISTLPLCYCCNVHPGRTLKEVLQGLERYAAEVRKKLGKAQLGVGLWLARPVVDELLSSPEALSGLSRTLAEHQLVCYTLNAFPFGDFHKERVKQEVYCPNWAETARRDYTVDCARVLCHLLAEGQEGSVSTVPLAYGTDPKYKPDTALTHLLQCADALHGLWEQTGRLVRLAIEPEPFCRLEQSEQVAAFFQNELWPAAERTGRGERVRQHVGVCFDVCHQAVLFEDVEASVELLKKAEVRMNKVHVSCALKAVSPGEREEVRTALQQFVEPRYLHQTFAQTSSGRLLRAEDLTEQLLAECPSQWQQAEQWRVHFHVPVYADTLGPLQTTRPELKAALNAVARLDYAPHLEVETYTWSVLPDEPTDLVSGLTRELTATEALLAQARHCRSNKRRSNKQSDRSNGQN